MLKKLANTIKFFLFGNLVEDQLEKYDHSYSDLGSTVTTQIKEQIKNGQYKNSYVNPKSSPSKKIKKQINTQVSIPSKIVETTKTKYEVPRNIENMKKTAAKKIDKNLIDKKIKINIFFIDNLMTKMEDVEEYVEYYDKLQDLKTQSQNLLKVMYNLKDNAPYYYNLLKAILKHANIIARLLEE